MSETQYVFDDNERRRALYVAMMEIAALFKAMPGGRDAALVGMAVALGSMDEQPVNVSSVADMIDIDRKKARRILTDLCERGFIHKKESREGWAVYERSLDEATQGLVKQMVDCSYSILFKHLFKHCAADMCGHPKCPCKGEDT